MELERIVSQPGSDWQSRPSVADGAHIKQSFTFAYETEACVRGLNPAHFSPQASSSINHYVGTSPGMRSSLRVSEADTD